MWKASSPPVDVLRPLWSSVEKSKTPHPSSEKAKLPIVLSSMQTGSYLASWMADPQQGDAEVLLQMRNGIGETKRIMAVKYSFRPNVCAQTRFWPKTEISGQTEFCLTSGESQFGNRSEDEKQFHQDIGTKQCLETSQLLDPPKETFISGPACSMRLHSPITPKLI
jgi:hypothetical protein